MVTQFTEDAAAILESKLLRDMNDGSNIEKGQSHASKKAQIEAMNRSDDQKRKFIKGQSDLFFRFKIYSGF